MSQFINAQLNAIETDRQHLDPQCDPDQFAMAWITENAFEFRTVYDLCNPEQAAN